MSGSAADPPSADAQPSVPSRLLAAIGDNYERRARLAPAVLIALPALALGIALLPALPGANRLWALVNFAALPLAHALVRRLGHATQADLWAAWDGPPTTQRLRWRSSPSKAVIAQRHADVQAALGGHLPLPTAAVEARDPAQADALYAEAVRRLLGVTRGNSQFPLLHQENANYGFARNLHGGKRLGQAISLASLLVALGVGIPITLLHPPGRAIGLLAPAVVAAIALLECSRFSGQY